MLQNLIELCGLAYMPHGQCYLWQPGLVWLHVISDGAIALAYYSIPITILYFVRRRADLPFPLMFLMFGAFIVACGTTHLMEVWTVWTPHYLLSGGIKAATALISLASAVALVRVVPLALDLPSPAALRELNEKLEERVRQRTADLTAANENLQREVKQRTAAEDEVRRLNEILRLRVDELQGLFDLLPVGVGIANDPGCRHVRMNAAFARMLDLPHDRNASKTPGAGERAPANFTILHDGREISPDELPMQRAAQTGQPVLDFHEIIRREDGTTIEVLANAVPLHDAAGAVRGCIATFQDITQHRQAEERRIAFERRLQETQKLESLGILAGGIAHDFNNLLAGILGNTGVARLELPETSPTLVREALTAIEDSTHRAADLCRQMLAYAGRGRFMIEPIDLSRLVHDTVSLLRVSISRKVVLQPELAEQLPAVQADATQLRQVLMNLVINASEAIGEGQGIVHLRTAGLHLRDRDLALLGLVEPIPAGRYVVLEVTDNGGGMDGATVARIFDPFFTTKFTGRGLGLAAVLGIVRGHQGGVGVQSQLGRGTTFRVFLPAATEEATPVRPAPAAKTDWRGSGRVLVIDDDEHVRAVAARILQRVGFTVTTAADGPAGLEAMRNASSEPFSVVVLDLTMPRMDGGETFVRLRELDARVPVLLASGYAESDAAQPFAGRGLAGFLAKPFTAEGLLTAVRQALETNQPPAGNDPPAVT